MRVIHDEELILSKQLYISEVVRNSAMQFQSELWGIIAAVNL